MKINIRFSILLLTILVVSAGISMAQTMVTLDIGSYYGFGTVKLNSGEVINDTLSFSFAGKGKVYLGSKYEDNPLELPKKYLPTDVEYFTIEDTTFVPVKTPQSLTGEFMIRMTPEDYKIQLYKKYEQDPQTYKILFKYFAMFPGQTKAKDIMSDLTLMPFAKKVPKNIADCPDLAGKIEKKEDPYKMPLLSNEKTFFTMYLKIAEAYQDCK